MNEPAIRAMLVSHQPHATRRAVELLLELVIELRETMTNQYLRHENQVLELRKEIARLKGTHGA